MRRVIFSLCFLLCFSCTKNPEAFIVHIDGYWEIESVELSNGSKRNYTFNETIDFLSISDSLKGFRKKLKPNFSGTYETSNNSEVFSMVIENDSLNMYYKTPFANWKETVLLANETQLIIINNANKDVYIYKRYKPLDLD